MKNRRYIDSTNFSQNDEEEGYSRSEESKSEREREEKSLDIPAPPRCPYHGDLIHLDKNGNRYCSYCEEIL